MSAKTYQETSWVWETRKFFQRLGEWLEARAQAPDPDLDLPDLPGWSPPEIVIRVLFWTIVLVLATLLLWRIWQLLNPYLRQWRSLGGLRRSIAQTTTAQRPRTLSYWIQQADRYYRQGQYREACRALYLALLQRLHDRQLLLQDPSRTDAEYWQTLQTVPKPDPYRTLLLTHERLCFSQTDITEDDFRDCQHALREAETP